MDSAPSSSSPSLVPSERPSSRRALRVAVIGGGAVAQRFHLPALAQAPDAIVAGLAELDGDRRTRLAGRYGIPHAVSDYRELIRSIDAAVITLPHHLHAPVATELLSNGIHVLVEKPMAQTTRECDEMIAAADASGAVLAIGLARRFVPAMQFTKHALASGILGEIRDFQIREGHIYDWNAVSAYAFEPASGGVLADIGAHVLDLVLWWFGDAVRTTYHDDARGGVEAECVVELNLASGVSGTIELSRSRSLGDVCTIRGSRGTLEVGTKPRSHLRLQLQGCPIGLQGQATSERSDSVDRFRLQLEDFLNAARDRRPPAISGREGRRSVSLLEQCHRERQPLDRPWDRMEPCRGREFQ